MRGVLGQEVTGPYLLGVELLGDSVLTPLGVIAGDPADEGPMIAGNPGVLLIPVVDRELLAKSRVFQRQVCPGPEDRS